MSFFFNEADSIVYFFTKVKKEETNREEKNAEKLYIETNKAAAKTCLVCKKM